MWSLINKAKWLLSGNMLFAFSQWLMLIFFSHYSNPLQLGYYSYALALTAPIFMLTNLQLRPILVVDWNTQKKYRFDQYFYIRIISTVIAIVISMILAFYNHSAGLLIIIIVVLMKSCEAISDIIYALYNAENKTRFISRSLIIKSIGIILISIVVLLSTGDVFYSLLAVLICYIVTLLLIDFKQIKKNLGRVLFWDHSFKKIFLTGLPLGLSVMLISLQTNIPRYFLEYSNGVEQVGVLTILYYFVVIGGIITNSICQYLSPYFSKYFHENEVELLKSTINKALFFSMGLGLLGILTSFFAQDLIMQLLYGEKYVQYSEYLPWMMLAGLFSYIAVVNGYIMTSLKLLKVQVPLFAILVICTIFYSWLLIPKFYLWGAVFTTVLSSMTQCLISYLLIYRKIKELN